ncbi:pirin family protein [Mucilaginibacter myungsuensis]|uniref:Pirin family protein n=1 Tax=Mucilaginibacter myungsuensis TaxID=649104 RepID=A0A929L2E1_9SPHI|nr:pirin family protein [Mucilaginibacter myungsuensis]MBE9662835.1 pirin family protein [Mucilaginibacter myungsuensis]MDN3598255.1 pirin family protein [Mucilaginibacter myungsuensis]
MKRTIEKIYKRPAQAGMVGDGFKVYNYFPGGGISQQRVSPFLMMDFAAEHNFTPTNKARGVDVHPHKGFETVTIAYKGSVAHHDSSGNSGIIDPGDVQWMTAGAGVLHKEYHEEEYSKRGGPFEMVQLWVNLPAKDKLTKPGYQGITADQMGKAILPDNGGLVNVIAGNFNGTKGPASTFTEVNAFDIKLNEGGNLQTNIPASHNAVLLVVEGDVEVNGEHADLHSFILFKNDGQEVDIKANEKSVLLLLSGEPIHEPIAQYGPFVMNTNRELQEAFEEFQAGKFGTLE